jgi:hypothetical protein
MDKEYLIPEWKASVDEIWAVLNRTAQMQQETAEQMKAMGAEADRRSQKIDEQLDKTDKQLEKLNRTVDRVTKNIGGVNRSFGELVEILISARLWEKFPQYKFECAFRRMPVFDENKRPVREIDILLSNTLFGMAVEVKREFDNEKYVYDHLDRMETIRKYPPAEIAGKQILGAVAGGVVFPEVQHCAHKSGLYVIEMTGKTAAVVPPPDGFAPRMW